jgi:hypothetical protein
MSKRFWLWIINHIPWAWLMRIKVVPEPPYAELSRNFDKLKRMIKVQIETNGKIIAGNNALHALDKAEKRMRTIFDEKVIYVTLSCTTRYVNPIIHLLRALIHLEVKLLKLTSSCKEACGA